MNIKAALKRDLTGVESKEYDQALYDRFISWKEQSGNTASRIAGMLNRSTAAVSQYVNRKYS